MASSTINNESFKIKTRHMHMYEAYIQSGPLLLTSMQCHHHAD